jgi:hypothetical protein
MISTLLHLLRLFPFLCGGHRQVALENLALRQQLAVYKRTASRPKLRTRDRLFWIWLSRVWTGWRDALVIVAPDTVLRWRRRRFREHWTKLSGRTRGRPSARQCRDHRLDHHNGRGEPAVGRCPSPKPSPADKTLVFEL